MATSATFAALTGLLSLVQGAVPSTVAVYDGPQITQNPVTDAVYVGVQNLSGEDRAAVTAQQDWAGLTNLRRNEDFTIYCVAYSYSGEANSYSTLRTTAASYVGLIESALRVTSDAPKLGVDAVVFSGISLNAINQGPNETGCSVDIEFTVSGMARL